MKQIFLIHIFRLNKGEIIQIMCESPPLLRRWNCAAYAVVLAGTVISANLLTGYNVLKVQPSESVMVLPAFTLGLPTLCRSQCRFYREPLKNASQVV